jgi:hypothetical protein
MFSSSLVCLLVTGVVLLGCGHAVAGRAQGERKSEEVGLGQAFKLRAGQQVTLEGEGLRVRFASVADDSRCPVDVACVWAGNAEVLLDISQGGDAALLKLHTHGGPQYATEGAYHHYTLELMALSPSPRMGKKIEAGDYWAMLVVRKE